MTDEPERDLHDGAAAEHRIGALRWGVWFWLRLLGYGLPSWLLVSVLYNVFGPLAEPDIVRRVEASRKASDDPSRQAGQDVADRTATESVASSTTLTLEPPEPLISPSVIIPRSLESHCSRWSRQYELLAGRTAVLEAASPHLSYRDAYRRLQGFYMELWDLTKDIDTVAHDEWADSTDPPDAWETFTGPVWEVLAEYRKRLTDDCLENFIRHERWASAALFCEYEGDTDNAIYFWRRAGGKDGHFRTILGSSGRSLDSVFSLAGLRGPGFYRAFSRLYPVPPPDGDDWGPYPLFPPTRPTDPLPYR